MSIPSSLPPIAAPDGSPVGATPAPFSGNRSWREAPFVVRTCAFYLTLFAAAAVIYGLSLIAYVQLLRSNFLLLALCVLGVLALIFLSGLYLIALRQGKKWVWYVQAVWSVVHTLMLTTGFLMALISGAMPTFVAEVSKEASPLATYISLSHIVISVLWFQTKVRRWFGMTQKEAVESAP